MHTVIVIGSGLFLLALFLLVGRFAGGGPSLATAAMWFIPVWLIAAGINLWIGVSRAGYTVVEELPIFLLVFAVPAAVAAIVWWRLSRG